jgi:hypothetical protein
VTQVSGGRSYDRFISFSDGVVAVAATVLILPIVDIAAPKAGQNVGSVLINNVNGIYSYLVTFIVIVIFWRVHHKILDGTSAYDGRLMILNTAWLATIAFLPWPTAMLGQEGGFARGVGTFYFGVLALSTLILLFMQLHIRRTPELWEDPNTAPTSRVSRSVVYITLWVFLAVLSLVMAEGMAIVSWVLFILGAVTLAIFLIMSRRKRTH